jgi:hypothetical protein
LADFLPLAAGSGEPLTGDLHIETASSAGIYLDTAASGTDFTRIYDGGAEFRIQKYRATGNVNLRFEGYTGSGVVYYNFSRLTDDGGVVRFYRGDATSTLQHSFNCGSGAAAIAKNDPGDVELTEGGGRVIIGTPASSGASLWNGSIAFYLDESGNNLVIEAQYSGGTTKTGTVALT